MKRILYAIFVIVLVAAAAVGCNRETEKDDFVAVTTPDEYCAEFDDADIIVSDEGGFYVEATQINWVVELDLQDATPVATVGRTGITVQFEPWDATVLPVGTAITRHNSEESVLIADLDGDLIPYLRYVSQ